MSGDRDEEIVSLEALLGRPHVSDDYVRFAIRMAHARYRVMEALEGAASFRAGVPLEAERFVFDREMLDELLVAIVGDGGELRWLREGPPGMEDLPERLARAAAFGPDADALQELTCECSIPVFALLLTGRMLAGPFLEAFRKRAGEVRRSPEGGRCPICDSPPGLSILEEEHGARRLVCTLCGQLWRFPRLRCPHCGCSDQEQLRTLGLEGEEFRWIETCEACKRYLKASDTRRLPPGGRFFPSVEEVASLHLDLLAEELGYVRMIGLDLPVA